MKELDLIQAKIMSWEALERKLHLWRFKGHTLSFTNGCYDLLHPGHINTLATAADEGDRLIVGLNSDASVARLKGTQRPVTNEYSRCLLMASIAFVDAVVVFDTDTPYELIKIVQPDVLVKGGDWKEEQIVGNDIVGARGGRVLSVPYLEGYSSSAIVDKIAGKQPSGPRQSD